VRSRNIRGEGVMRVKDGKLRGKIPNYDKLKSTPQTKEIIRWGGGDNRRGKCQDWAGREERLGGQEGGKSTKLQRFSSVLWAGPSNGSVKNTIQAKRRKIKGGSDWEGGGGGLPEAWSLK